MKTGLVDMAAGCSAILVSAAYTVVQTVANKAANKILVFLIFPSKDINKNPYTNSAMHKSVVPRFIWFGRTTAKDYAAKAFFTKFLL